MIQRTRCEAVNLCIGSPILYLVNDYPALILEPAILTRTREVKVLLPPCLVHLVVLPRRPLVGDGIGCLPVIVAVLVMTGHGAARVLADVRDAGVL